MITKLIDLPKYVAYFRRMFSQLYSLVLRGIVGCLQYRLRNIIR